MSDNDYPAGALKRREEGTVSFQLLIGLQGRAIRCTITQSSGSADLDAATCNRIVADSKFKPATDESGQPSYSAYDGRINWHLPGRSTPFRGRPPAPPAPAMELTVQKIPDGSRAKMIGLIARFDAAGQMVACEPSPSSSKEVKLASVACQQAKAIPGEIIKDNDGSPISMVRGIRVLFKTAE